MHFCAFFNHFYGWIFEIPLWITALFFPFIAHERTAKNWFCQFARRSSLFFLNRTFAPEIKVCSRAIERFQRAMLPSSADLAECQILAGQLNSELVRWAWRGNSADLVGWGILAGQLKGRGGGGGNVCMLSKENCTVHLCWVGCLIGIFWSCFTPLPVKALIGQTRLYSSNGHVSSVALNSNSNS